MKRAVTLLCLLLSCAVAQADDVAPANVYFPVLPLDAPDSATPQAVPVAVNHQLSGAHNGITRAIIIIPDGSRDAASARVIISSLAGADNSTTMIIAPQFLLSSDLVSVAASSPESGRFFAIWQPAGWPIGNQSIATRPQDAVSSFTVADLLLMYLSDRDVFPDLKNITVAGFGAGAVFVQRYAAFAAAADAVAQENISLRFVVADAPSYLYLTANRPLGGQKGFGRPDSAKCPAYDAYPYGLAKLNPYARRVGANAAKIGYATRFITYLNTPAPDAAPDAACAALDQGGGGAARAANYRLYLQTLYGDTTEQTQIFATVKDVKNDAVALFGSACGMSALFGEGSCP